MRRVCAPRTSVSELASWNRFWMVPCGTRKEVPSWMLGNVSWGPDASGLMTFLNVLKDAVVTLTSVGVQMRVQDPTID